MCKSDPDCVAFNSKGELFHKADTVEDPEIMLYMKRN